MFIKLHYRDVRALLAALDEFCPYAELKPDEQSAVSKLRLMEVAMRETRLRRGGSSFQDSHREVEPNA